MTAGAGDVVPGPQEGLRGDSGPRVDEGAGDTHSGAQTVSSLRPVYDDPDRGGEGWDEDHDRAVIENVGWDLAFGCRVSFGFDRPYDGDPGRGWTANVSLSDGEGRGSTHRSVTPAQLRDFAHKVLAFVDEYESS